MKKVLSVFLVLFIFGGSSIACFAQSEEDINVYAKYSYSDDVVISKIYSEKADAEIFECAKINIALPNNEYDGLLLAVRHVDSKKENAAWSWMKSKLPKNSELSEAFEIFIIDENGRKLDLPKGTRVEIFILKDIENVFMLSCNGNNENIDFDKNFFEISFISNGAEGYYILSRNKISYDETTQENETDEDDSTKAETTVKPDVPDTGVKGGSVIFGAALLSAGAMFCVGKKQKQD